MIFQSNATDSEPSSHVRQLIFHTCQANQWQGGEGMALMLLWGGPACSQNTKNAPLGCGVAGEAALAAVGTKRVGPKWSVGNRMGTGSTGRLGPAGKGRERTRNGERIHGKAVSCWKAERKNQEHPESALPLQYKVIFLLLAPGLLARAPLLAQGSAPQAPRGWSCPSAASCPHQGVPFPCFGDKSRCFPSHCLCSSGLICPLMDNLSALGCSGRWEEIHGRVMPSALSGGFGNLTFNLFCRI